MSADNPFAQRIATAIKRWRLRLGWSQQEASWRVGVLPPEISRWETALRTPGHRNLARICAAYGLTPAELLREDEPLLPPGWPPEALDALRDSPELRDAIAAILKTADEGGEP